MNRTIVIGGSGFIGNALQTYVLEKKLEKEYVFSFCNHGELIRDGLEKIQLDILNIDTLFNLNSFSNMIYLAGNANHRLAKEHPLLDLKLNVFGFLNLIENFSGTLVLLSSQAVYFGLEGEVLESVDHVSTIPYGLSKQMVETYAKYLLQTNKFSKLWIYRLMNSYGVGEKERRIIPQCALSSNFGEEVKVYGKGKSYLNPLPSWFIAKVLVKTIQFLMEKDRGFVEIVNLNHKSTLNVLSLVEFLNTIKPFNYSIIESGEEWPVNFWGNTLKMNKYLSQWDCESPDLFGSIKEYYLWLINNSIKE